MTITQQLDAALSGRYQLEREIGAGGMATVYLARDVRHDRHVALKVLRPELSAILGAERFVKEIRTTANLQHPHILPLHDSGEANGLVFYVMPFVEGESLRDRLARETQLPVADAVRIAREVASALDYAHRRGVVHRDIKPENILLHDGQALVADFGIALAVSAVGGGTRLTETGMSLGTPHYMSPEQAMGEREITARSDVYALGCVLYEMLVGEPPFTGPTAQAIVARVMTEEPRSPSTARATVPAHVAAAVLTALAKLPADRFATAAEFAGALGTPGYSGVQVAGAAPADPARRPWLADPRTVATLVGAAALVSLAALWPRGGEAGASGEGVTRLRIVPDDTTPGLSYIRALHGAPAVSPDGRVVAFALARNDTTALYVQALDRFEQSTVEGGGRLPFFSPDGRWLGFLRGGSVWKVPTAGGTPTRLGSIETESSAWTLDAAGVWHPNGQIYFGTPAGLRMLPATGGAARTIAIADAGGRYGEIFGMGLTPDGRLLAGTMVGDSARLVLVSPDGADVQRLPADIGGPAWFVGDLLVFTRERQRYAAAFDLRALVLVGEPVPISDFTNAVDVAPGTTAAWFEVWFSRRVEPVWVDRTGEAVPLGLPPGGYSWPRLSPDGRRLAFHRYPERNLSVVELITGRRTQLPPSGGGEPAWFRDGNRIVMSAVAVPQYGLISLAVGAGRAPDTLVRMSPRETFPTDVSPGDSLVLYYGNDPGEEQDVFVLDVRTRVSRRIAHPGSERGARFSPDGRWIAMQSLEQGRTSIVVLPWPALDAQHVVSEVGEEPAWSHDGRELYFRSGGRMMVVRVVPGAMWSATAPEELFRGPFASDLVGDQSYDVAPDGRFLMLRFSGDSRPRISVIRNWAAELARRLAEANP